MSAAVTPADPAAEDALAAFRRVLLDLSHAIDANLPGAIDGVDPERLHDLRVAVRRTRSILAEGKGVLPEHVRTHYRSELRWLGQVTGPPRDLDVYVLGWDDHVAPLDAEDRAVLESLRRELEVRRLRAHRALSQELGSSRAVELLASWRAWLLEPTDEGDRRRAIGPLVARRVRSAQRTVLRDGRKIRPGTSGDRLHDLRKHTKKLRYLLECFAGVLPRAPRRRFIRQLKALQDNLGAYQDAEVHVTLLRDLASEVQRAPDAAPDVLQALGRLIDHLELEKGEARRAFAERFAAYDTTSNHRTFDEMLREVERG